MAIKMKVLDWWQPDTRENFDNNPFINLLRQKYEIIYSDAPDFILCGPFGSAHFDYECVKIFYTGENLRIDWNLYDYGMGFDYMDFGARYLHLPLFYLYKYDFKARALGERSRFCAYIVRHSGANHYGAEGGLRDRFFDKLSAYKRVDSGGGWRNNIGGAVENKHLWLQDYKFNICFENSSSPGYLTEKLFDAYNAGCIPIYWGDTSLKIGANSINSSLGTPCGDLADFGHCADSSPVLRPKSAKNSTTSTANTRICDLDSEESQNLGGNQTQFAESSLDSANFIKSKMGGGNRTYNPNDLDSIDTRIPQISPHLLDYKINPKAFINAHNFPNLDALVEEVKRIDNDENAYNAMRNEPLFLDDFHPKEFYEKRILEFFDNIFSQSPSEAFRRGEGLLLQNYRNGIANMRECATFSKNAIKLAKYYTFLRKGAGKVSNKLKFWR